MTSTQAQQIAAIIWQQLMSREFGGGLNVVGSWGSVTRQKVSGIDEETGYAFLRIRVAGRKLKGTVKILLNRMDNYDIHFYRESDYMTGNMEPYRKVEDIGVENMAECIDREVETGPVTEDI